MSSPRAPWSSTGLTAMTTRRSRDRLGPRGAHTLVGSESAESEVWHGPSRRLGVAGRRPFVWSTRGRGPAAQRRRMSYTVLGRPMMCRVWSNVVKIVIGDLPAATQTVLTCCFRCGPAGIRTPAAAMRVHQADHAMFSHIPRTANSTPLDGGPPPCSSHSVRSGRRDDRCPRANWPN